MDPDSWLYLGGSVLAIVVFAVVSLSEASLGGLTRTHLRLMLAQERPGAKAVESLLERPLPLHLFLLTLRTSSLIAASVLLTVLIAGRALSPAWAVGISVGSLVVLLLVLLVPCLVQGEKLRRLALGVAPSLNWLLLLVSPLLFPLIRLLRGRATSGDAEPLIEGSPLTAEELRLLVNVDIEGEDVIEEEEKEMIASIFELGKTQVREVMVPRVDMVSVDVDTPPLEALDVLRVAGHSRIPVHEDTIDDVVGLLYAKDLLFRIPQGDLNIPLRDILRPAYFIPETKPVDELLQELQRRKVHMAIVVDEYGGTAGLVTIEDLLEEIVGEIQDEYDAEESRVEKISDNEMIFDARFDLDDVNRLMSLKLPTERSSTLGGLVYSLLGRVPATKDRVELDGVSIEVLSVSGKRIRKVKVTKEPPEGEAKGGVQGNG